MPSKIEMWENPGSGSISSSGRAIELSFTLKGTDDRIAVLSHILLNTEAEISGVPRGSFDAEIVDGHTDLWDITIPYEAGGAGTAGGLPTPDIGDERTVMSTKGGSTRIFQALEHIADYGVDLDEGEPPINHQGAINVTTDTIEGVEIEIPGVTMTITKIVAAEDITREYTRSIFQATKKVNTDLWRGYEPGELYFDGAVISQRDSESYEVVFEFTASENETDGTVGPITGIVKAGHHYAWSEHTKVVDESTDPPTKRSQLLAVHIERVFGEASFVQKLALDHI